MYKQIHNSNPTVGRVGVYCKDMYFVDPQYIVGSFKFGLQGGGNEYK